jgi:hypothetical protein
VDTQLVCDEIILKFIDATAKCTHVCDGLTW